MCFQLGHTHAHKEKRKGKEKEKKRKAKITSGQDDAENQIFEF